MSKKLLTGMALICVGMMCASCAVAPVEDGRTYNTSKTLADYDAKEDSLNMEIYAYFPDNTENGMKLAKEAGISAFLLTRDGEYITTKPEAVQATIELAAKYDLGAFPFTGHLQIDSDESLKADWLYEYDNIAGIYYYDEPYMQHLTDLGNRVAFFEKNFPGKTYLVALHPSTVVEHPSWTTDATYEEYVYTYCSEVIAKMSDDTRKVLMADCYPIIYKNNEYQIKPSHLYNIMELAAQAKDFGAEANLAVQTLEHTVGNGATWYPEPTLQSLRLQVNTLFCFGYKGYTFYTWDTRPDVLTGEKQIKGVVKDGEATSIYSVVKQVNEEVLSYDHVYLSFSWDGIIPLVVTDDQRNNLRQLTEFGRYVLTTEDTKVLNDLQSDNNILCGVFHDDDGNEAYALTNYCAPQSGNVANAEMTFDDCDKAIVYFNGEKSVVDLTDGKLSLTLDCGDGVFVIPYKA